MKRTLAFAAILISLPLTAQTTWNGLHFGMSIEDAQNVMAASKTVMSASDPLTLESTNDYDLQLEHAAIPFPLKVQLHFNNTGLSTIDLILDAQEFHKRHPSSSEADAVMVFSSMVYEALHARYGTPIEQKKECDALAAPGGAGSWDGCSADWSAGGQKIGFISISFLTAHTATIQYSPVTKEL